MKAPLPPGYEKYARSFDELDRIAEEIKKTLSLKDLEALRQLKLPQTAERERN